MKGPMGRVAVVAVPLIALAGGVAVSVVARMPEALAPTIPLGPPQAAGSIAFDARAGDALVASAGPHASLRILDTRTDRVVHIVALPQGFIGAITIAQGTGRAFVLTYLGAPGRLVSMVDIRAGTLLRTIRVPTGCHAAAVDEQSGHVFIVSTGSPRPDGTPCGPGIVTMLDGRSGAVVARVPVGLMPGAAAVDQKARHVFVPNLRSNTVSILDARTGIVVHTTAVGRAPSAVVVDTLTRHVFVSNWTDQTVSVLDAGSGQVLRTVVVGGAPPALAADDYMGRVVVAAVRGYSSSMG